MKKAKPKKSVRFLPIGELPPGDWEFGLLSLVGQKDVVIVTDRTGANPPQFVYDGKLVTVF